MIWTPSITRGVRRTPVRPGSAPLKQPCRLPKTAHGGQYLMLHLEKMDSHGVQLEEAARHSSRRAEQLQVSDRVVGGIISETTDATDALLLHTCMSISDTLSSGLQTALTFSLVKCIHSQLLFRSGCSGTVRVCSSMVAAVVAAMAGQLVAEPCVQLGPIVLPAGRQSVASWPAMAAATNPILRSTKRLVQHTSSHGRAGVKYVFTAT